MQKALCAERNCNRLSEDTNEVETLFDIIQVSSQALAIERGRALV